jgi:hypothetical protein
MVPSGDRAVAAATYAEQQGHHGANTFTNYHNASGMGPRVDPAAWVQVSCKVHDPYIPSVNPDGYWYLLSSSPWNDQYYAAANTFMNGDPWNGPYTHNTDFNVPDCGAPPPPPPPPPPSPTVRLTQGPTAPYGYRYAITLSNFAANSAISISCRDSVSPSGFYSFKLTTNGSGQAFTQSYCYTNDGPDHWVIANGIESNHVAWGARQPSGGTTSTPQGAGTESSSSSSGAAPTPSEVCDAFSGTQSPASNISDWLFGRFESGYGSLVVIPWSYFSENPQFVRKAKSIKEGDAVVGWRAVFPSDMYFALGHFTIKHTSVHCYTIEDTYDFSNVELPMWLQQQLHSAIPFKVRSSGKL